jgi:hypothetical protein
MFLIWAVGAALRSVRRTSCGAGIRRMNCDRITSREGHVECLIETRVKGLFGPGFFGHTA